jgi:hypothetical protein
MREYLFWEMEPEFANSDGLIANKPLRLAKEFIDAFQQKIVWSGEVLRISSCRRRNAASPSLSSVPSREVHEIIQLNSPLDPFREIKSSV